MALSEEEQRLLDQLEASLVADDPRLANTMSNATPRIVHKRRAALAGLGLVAGLALLIGGIQWSPLLSVLGFVLMFASAIMGIGAWRHVGPDADQPQTRRRPAKTPGGDGAFFERMEERWRKRQEGGL